MNKFKTILAASFLIVGLSSQACTLGAWDANLISTALAGGPEFGGIGSTTDFARYQGACSMKTDGLTPAVKNSAANSLTSGPGAEGSMVARFYFLPGVATGTIFEAYSDDGTTVVYSVDYSGGNVTVTPTGGAGTASAAVGGTNWHSVEISWANNGGDVNLWLDTTSTTDGGVTTEAVSATTTSAVDGTTINSVILGGVTGMIFDGYESRRNNAIGRVLVGDATGDGNINVIDASAVVGEASGGFVNGNPGSMPDCTQDGTVNVIDASCVIFLASL